MIKKINALAEITGPIFYLLFFQLSSVLSLVFFAFTLIISVGRLSNKIFLNLLFARLVQSLFSLTSSIILLFIYLFIFLPLSISVKKKSLDVFSNSKNHWIGLTSNHEFDFRRLG